MMQVRNRRRRRVNRMSTNDANRPCDRVALRSLQAHAYKRRGHSSRVSDMTFGTWLFTKMRGELVGTDAEGNRYFQDKRIDRRSPAQALGDVQRRRRSVARAARLARLAALHDRYAAARRRLAAQDVAEGARAQSQRHRPRLSSAGPHARDRATSPSRLTRRGVRVEARGREARGSQCRRDDRRRAGPGGGRRLRLLCLRQVGP